jgi:hypothetical protein
MQTNHKLTNQQLTHPPPIITRQLAAFSSSAFGKLVSNRTHFTSCNPSNRHSVRAFAAAAPPYIPLHQAKSTSDITAWLRTAPLLQPLRSTMSSLP